MPPRRGFGPSRGTAKNVHWCRRAALIAAIFSVTERAAREGRNPATGETIQIAVSCAAKFSAAPALKQRLNS